MDHISLLDNVLKESHLAGDSDATVVDSWVYSISLAAHARENGANIYTDFRVDYITRSEKVSGSHNENDERLLTNGRRDEIKSSDIPLAVRGKAVVNATGNWSDVIEK